VRPISSALHTGIDPTDRSDMHTGTRCPNVITSCRCMADSSIVPRHLDSVGMLIVSRDARHSECSRSCREVWSDDSGRSQPPAYPSISSANELIGDQGEHLGHGRSLRATRVSSARSCLPQGRRGHLRYRSCRVDTKRAQHEECEQQGQSQDVERALRERLGFEERHADDRPCAR